MDVENTYSLNKLASLTYLTWLQDTNISNVQIYKVLAQYTRKPEGRFTPARYAKMLAELLAEQENYTIDQTFKAGVEAGISKRLQDENATGDIYTGTYLERIFSSFDQSNPPVYHEWNDKDKFILLVPFKNEQKLYFASKQNNLKTCCEYMKKRFKHEKAEVIVSLDHKVYGKCYVIASYNTKNRDESFGYVIDANYRHAVDSLEGLLFMYMYLMRTCVNTPEFKEKANYRAVEIGDNFLWFVNNADLKYSIPNEVVTGWYPGCIEQLFYKLKKGTLFLMYTSTIDTSQLVLDPRKHLKSFLDTCGSENANCYTTGDKGFQIETPKGILEFYKVTDAEYNAIRKKNENLPPVLTLKNISKVYTIVDNEWVEHFRQDRNWNVMKGKMPAKLPADYKIALLLSRLQTDDTKAHYFIKPETLLNRKDWDVVKIRKDKKKFIIDTKDGKMREYVLLTNKEINIILKYMGLSNIKEINYALLKRKVNFFYTNMDVFSKLLANNETTVKEKIDKETKTEPEKAHQEQITKVTENDLNLLKPEDTGDLVDALLGIYFT